LYAYVSRTSTRILEPTCMGEVSDVDVDVDADVDVDVDVDADADAVVDK
jgi:hypothetical protein